MTDMPEFRAWADRAHKASIQPIKRKKNKPKRYKCINPSCDHGTTRSQARLNDCTCRKCGSDLISKKRLNEEFGNG